MALATGLLHAPTEERRLGLRERVGSLRDRNAALWAATPPELPVMGPRVGFRRHFANSRAAAGLIETLAAEVSRLPAGKQERQAWRETVRERVQEFGATRLGWPTGYRRILFGDAFFAASRTFARDARAFDPRLSLDDLWQALRNVWIGNSLQMLLDLEVTLNPGLFAYSLLYPLTDNLLDDPRLSASAKRGFSERFGARLSGLSTSPAGPEESAVFRLVGRIEAEFPRHRFADVHESLLAIHGGQARSLGQQDPGLTDAEILQTSCEKGGSSVLADLYLVAGRATPAEESFAFGYGVFLQLLDDLQDVEDDILAGHETLFTRAAERGPLDAPTARLAAFIDRVLDGGEPFAGPPFADRKDLIRRNCQSLLVGAVAELPRRFSRRFRHRLGRHWPFGLGALRRLRDRAQRRFRDAAKTLQLETGAPSLLDWMLAQED
jgi:hypothetical protein